MPENDIVPEADIEDVSLVDTPDIAPTAIDTPSDTAQTPNESADTQDKQDPADKPDDAEANEANESDPTDQKPDDEQRNSKEYQNQRARMAWQERQRTRSQVAEQLDQQYGPKTEQELIDEGANPNDAKFEAFKQEIAYKEERTRVAELNAGMRAEAVEVTKDFPVFDSTSDQYDEQFALEVQQSYQQAARLQTLQTGTNPDGSPVEVVTNADVPLYDYYQRMYNIYNRGTSKGAQQRQTATQDMMSRTENPGGSSSTNAPAPGSLEEMEQRFGDVIIT